MSDPRFFLNQGPFRLDTLAAAVGGRVAGGDAKQLFEDVAPLSKATRDHVSFLDNAKYVGSFRGSQAGACVVHPDFADQAPSGMALIVTDQPYRAYAVIASLFYPQPPAVAGVAPSAVVDSTAFLAENVAVAAGAVIGAYARLGEGTRIGANAVIGPGVQIGASSSVGANAVVTHAIIGCQVHIYAGCCIGQDGFGFAMGAKGHLKVPQLGRVIIGDDVEIGANTTIDRGAGPDTVIGSGCRIDNLVQIGHNVELGEGCVIVSQVGVAGSTRLGQGVVVAGQVAIAGHLLIGDGAQIAGKSGVMRDVAPGTAVMGYPAKPIRAFWREVAALKGLVTRKSPSRTSS